MTINRDGSTSKQIDTINHAKINGSIGLEFKKQYLDTRFVPSSGVTRRLVHVQISVLAHVDPDCMHHSRIIGSRSQNTEPLGLTQLKLVLCRMSAQVGWSCAAMHFMTPLQQCPSLHCRVHEGLGSRLHQRFAQQNLDKSTGCTSHATILALKGQLNGLSPGASMPVLPDPCFELSHVPENVFKTWVEFDVAKQNVEASHVGFSVVKRAPHTATIIRCSY